MTEVKQTPVLWMVENSRGISQGLFFSENDARNEADRLNTERLRSDYVAVSLYRDPPPPTLTDAERSVLRGLRDDYAFRRSNENCQRVASVLDDLLARLGGGE